jgi:hypothetical protein
LKNSVGDPDEPIPMGVDLDEESFTLPEEWVYNGSSFEPLENTVNRQLAW